MPKKKPYNILIEAYVMGMSQGISSLTKCGVTAGYVERELDKIAKEFGYSGLKEFDKSRLTDVAPDDFREA